MAQATRLNLRMQKELKLLLTDPPPGVSFPSLPDGSSASSLTSFDALLQGPEGSVYANGAFKINIQIPERYPFQPPIVTFATPIYHPNIDNGGRICLDILNLPPKGTWKPSLNISTVLTSIGLLLSEPNPDDGLMHDASREYKYNRQTFDENARFITEKYARESESAKGYHGSQTHIGSSTGQTETEESGPSICVTEQFVCHEMCSGSGRKRPLESLGSSSNHDSGIHKLHLHDCLMNHIDIGPLKEANETSAEHAGNPGKLHATRNKMPLKISLVSHGKDDGSTNMESEKQYSSLLENQTPSTDPLAFLPLVQVGNNHELISDREDYTERSHRTSVSPEQQLSCCVKTSRSRDSNEKLCSVPKRDSSPLDSTRRLEALPLLLGPSHNRTSSKNHTGEKEHDSSSMSVKKAGLVGLTPSSGAVGCSQHLLKNEKEYTSPLQCLTPQLAGQPAALERAGKQEMSKGLALSQTDAQLPLEPADQLLGYNNLIILQSTNASSPHSKFLHVTDDLRYDEKQQIDQVCDEDSAGKLRLYSEDPHMPEAVIVSDSEDSEDGNVPLRSKLSLDKRRMTRKWKA